MSLPASKIVLLVCGKVRDPAGFAADLAVYRRWLESGSISSFIFSGWRSDESENRDALAEIRSMGGLVVLSPDPAFVVTGHIFHQMKNLYHGLSQVDPEAFVIKTRTDKVSLSYNVCELVERAARASRPSGSSPFRRRVSLIAVLPLMPFFYNDMIFAGWACDLAKLISFDLWFEVQAATINAEQILHSAPFRADLAERALIDGFFRANPGLVHTNAEDAANAQRLLLADPLYQIVLCRSLERLLTCYNLGLTVPREPWSADNLDGATLADLPSLARAAAVNGLSYHAGANTIELRRPELVPMMLNMPISVDEHRSLRQMVDQTHAIASPNADALSEALSDRVRDAFPNWDHVASSTIRQDGLLIHDTRKPTTIRTLI